MKLYAVTVNWNQYELTERCIVSLFQAGLNERQLIVVDNGSSDDSPNRLKRRFGDTIVQIANSENQGYVLAVNQGIEYALALGADWVLIINNDTFVAESFLEYLMPVLNQGLFAILGPVIFYADDPRRVWYLGDRLIDGTLLTWGLLRNQFISPNLPPIVEVDFVSGCGMLVRRDVFENIGIFDPLYEMYTEEVDFCWRARKAGYKFACVTQAHMWHVVSATASRDKPRTRYLRVRNQIWFYRKYAKGGQRILLFLFSLLKVLYMSLGDIISFQGGLLKATAAGWFDGWFIPQMSLG